ncbi:MAG: hypothetical protein ACI90V_006681 [Bacillariaceae sp.]|jgi:hypothetical protein
MLLDKVDCTRVIKLISFYFALFLILKTPFSTFYSLLDRFVIISWCLLWLLTISKTSVLKIKKGFKRYELYVQDDSSAIN